VTVERLLDAKEIGELLGVPPSWVAREAREGRMPCLRLGKYVRFEFPAVEAWLVRQRSGDWPNGPRASLRP
jgi:excisionase family DNA binding protein